MTDATPPTPVDHHRRVLDIETTLSVTLANKKIRLSELIDLVPGSMLNFDVHCDQPLTLMAAGTEIAVGETVKVGDKFGLQIRQFVGDNSD